jgi:hypothetical protein
MIIEQVPANYAIPDTRGVLAQGPSNPYLATTYPENYHNNGMYDITISHYF